MNTTRSSRMTRRQLNKMESLEGQLGFRIKAPRLGIIQKSVQVQSEVNGVNTTARLGGMPAGSPQTLDYLPAAATTMIISSSSVDDTILGLGCRKLVVQGLDANWDMISETIEMSGRTGTTTTKVYLRLNKIYSDSVGATGHNIGDVYASQTGLSTLTLGVPADGEVVRAMINTTNFDTYGIFSVPRAHKFQYQMINSYSDATQTKPILMFQEGFYANGDGTERIRFNVGYLFQTGDVSWDATGSLPEPAKTDVIFTASTETGTATLNYYNEYALIPDSLVLTHG